jgi:hypothetical protein
VSISDKEQIKQWADDHTEDSYFFMTRVRGEFPSFSALQFIPNDLVEAAMSREIVHAPNDPLVLGVDVARFGDDASVIYARKGMDARSILPMVRGISTDRLESFILDLCQQHRVECILSTARALVVASSITWSTDAICLSRTYSLAVVPTVATR